MQPEKENPKLEFISGIKEGEQVQIQGKVCIIGRDPSADIPLDSPFVSRHHAEIRSEGVYWTIADLFSKNGVFRNKARIEPGEPIQLLNNDEIQIGSVCVFRFVDPEDTLLEADMQMRTPGIWLDELNREVYVHNNKLDPPLSQQQFDLLVVLFRHQREVVTNEMIAEALWPGAVGGIENAAIDNAFSRLRSRLAELDPDHEYLETVRGVGRRFVQRVE
ncbi:MAG: FHA domain-containing protein [Anaerolineaceae bacterium]|nr:FHA domain-containing protein [Anaerolineaceae bacterium]